VAIASCFLDQVEGDGTDEHARPEGHDQPDDTRTDLEQQRHDGTDHQRRSRQGPPSERASHLALSIYEYPVKS
jgi:hypothetical protein